MKEIYLTGILLIGITKLANAESVCIKGIDNPRPDQSAYRAIRSVISPYLSSGAIVKYASKMTSMDGTFSFYAELMGTVDATEERLVKRLKESLLKIKGVSADQRKADVAYLEFQAPCL